jgi:hypothetical protein
MLITERTSDGRTIVRLHKDWHPNRISKAYQRPLPNLVQSKDAWTIQSALLRKQS